MPHTLMQAEPTPSMARAMNSIINDSPTAKTTIIIEIINELKLAII